jgi:hypothetical protein
MRGWKKWIKNSIGRCSLDQLPDFGMGGKLDSQLTDSQLM